MYLTGLDMFYPAHKIVGNEELSSSSSISCVCLKSFFLFLFFFTELDRQLLYDHHSGWLPLLGSMVYSTFCVSQYTRRSGG